MTDFILWGTAGLFVILGVILLSGRGSFLIAGYNTASKAEKAKYDVKKLCRVNGVVMVVVAVCIIVMIFLQDTAPGLGSAFTLVGVLLAVLVGMALSNTICVKKDRIETAAVMQGEEETEEKRRSKKVELGTGIFTAVVFIGAGFLLLTGDIKVQFHEESLEIIGSYQSDKEISYEEIKSVELLENFRFGSRVGGFGSFKLNMGRFNNEEFGRYTLYAYVKCRTVVVLETEDGMVVVNAETPEETEKLYEEIVEAE